MTNNLIPLLDELSQLAPDVCNAQIYPDDIPTIYQVGNYEFWIIKDELTGSHLGMVEGVCSGQPALDWLQGALMRVIREQGMYWELRYSKPRNRYQAEIANHTVWNNDATEALLTAFIQALKGE